MEMKKFEIMLPKTANVPMLEALLSGVYEHREMSDAVGIVHEILLYMDEPSYLAFQDSQRPGWSAKFMALRDGEPGKSKLEAASV